MAALPYMRMYWADYDADTAHLTAMQHGIYLLLIKNYWQRGAPLPDDELRLSRIAKVSLKDWRRNEAVIREFFTVEESLWHHNRIAQELSRVEAKSLKAKESALANAKRTQSKRSPNAERTPIYTDTDTDIDSSVTEVTAASGNSDKAFWASARAYLGPEKASMIGKWVKDHGRAATAEAISAAQVERAVDPISFIQGRFRKVKAQPVIPI
jgi:uncharacterized protein YdaU (DUF1376 family)